jgi:hypothetical protein
MTVHAEGIDQGRFQSGKLTHSLSMEFAGIRDRALISDLQ